MPLVSVVVPVFNGEEVVAKAIQSILDQTFSDWEMIILDDGSTDRTLEVCRKYACSDPRIRVSSNRSNLGLAATMNILVNVATGKYVAVQEQDDVSLTDRLEHEVRVLESHPEIGLVSGIAAWVDDDGVVFNYFPGMLCNGNQFPTEKSKMVELLYVEQSKIVNAACMFRRQLIDGVVEPFDEHARMSIDWQFFVDIAHQTIIYGLPEVLVKMNRGRSNTSLSTRKELMFEEARRCIRVLSERYSRRPDSPITHRLFRRSMATELTFEARYWGGSRGLLRTVAAIAYDPRREATWRSLAESFQRALRKLLHHDNLGNREQPT